MADRTCLLCTRGVMAPVACLIPAVYPAAERVREGAARCDLTRNGDAEYDADADSCGCAWGCACGCDCGCVCSGALRYAGAEAEWARRIVSTIVGWREAEGRSEIQCVSEIVISPWRYGVVCDAMRQGGV